MDEELLEEARSHDAALARRGLAVWIGAEPTFTDRRSQDPWWLSQAEGGDKEPRARDLLRRLAARLSSGARLVRAHGRHYPGEPAPRFCLGMIFDRAPLDRACEAVAVSSPRSWPRQARPGAAPAGDEPPPYGTEGGWDDAPALEGGPVAAPVPAEGEAWLTVTPDPGVVEVNMAPAPDLATFLAWSEEVYAAADEAGLSPVRYRYNGDATDSGGGGQITLGGPSPERSPFFLYPQLLPRLVRHANRHPSLSYAFAPECTGSASQGPRADEGVRERFEELPVALDRLAARGDLVTPEELWSSLAPLLVDAAGNSHRAEINVEKLWNPWFGERGRLGLVELRALRMPETPARLAAVAGLFRAVAARLAAFPYEEPLVDWGASLHELFGLPWFLRQDLAEVLHDLEAHGFGLGPRLREELLRPPEPVARVEHEGAALEITPALSFWPLFGDVASQERNGARLVDSSSARLQVVVTTGDGDPPGTVAAGGWLVPLQACPERSRGACPERSRGACPEQSRGAAAGDARRHVGSVLYRTFTPRPGLHPGLAASDPLVLSWTRGSRALSVALHGWEPSGGTYDGLPADAGEARRRRRARVVVAPAPPVPARRARDTAFTLDLRRAGCAGGLDAAAAALPPPSP